MRLGVSTASLYPTYTEDALEWFCSRGIRHFECFMNTMAETRPELLRRFRNTLEACHADVVSVHPFVSMIDPLLFFSEYRRRIEDGLEIYRHFFEAAAYLGAKILVFHGDSIHSPLSEEESFCRYAILAEEAQRFGILLTQENTVSCRARDPQYLLRMKNYLGGTAAFTFDIKQARRSGFVPADFLPVLGSSIRHIHISDGSRENLCLPVGKGTDDMQGFFNALHDISFDGSIIMELYHESYDQPEEILEGMKCAGILAKNAGYTTY